QFVLQAAQRRDLPTYDRDLVLYQPFNLVAIGMRRVFQAQKLPNLLQRKSQLLRITNEGEVFDIRNREQPKASARTRGGVEEPSALIEANRIHCQPGLCRHLTNLQETIHELPPYLAAYTLESTPESRGFC